MNDYHYQLYQKFLQELHSELLKLISRVEKEIAQPKTDEYHYGVAHLMTKDITEVIKNIELFQD